jgi:ribose/xylose/arabinose/galactoside ABC-type transport system permease subunit
LNPQFLSGANLQNMGGWAVLGGCSLRGGEGSIIGILIGTALLQVLQNLRWCDVVAIASREIDKIAGGNPLWVRTYHERDQS